jgi:hypothetical protein
MRFKGPEPSVDPSADASSHDGEQSPATEHTPEVEQDQEQLPDREAA